MLYKTNTEMVETKLMKKKQQTEVILNTEISLPSSTLYTIRLTYG